MAGYPSWGNFPSAQQEARRIFWRNAPLPRPSDGATILPRGLGRSYGDSCLNDGGLLLDATGLDRLIDFDPTTGVLRCEAGLSLAAILDLMVPRGWFLPVTPGTKFVTVAGALANDIHGKNHHRAGTFGHHVRRFELVRSDGRRMVCSPQENEALFRATIGGLGLTGFITWVEFTLKPITSERIDRESIKFSSLGEFLELTRNSDERFEYTVAWIDCLASGPRLGRGIFFRGNHATGSDGRPKPGRPQRLSVPLYAPNFVLGPLTVRSFNTLYYKRQRRKLVTDSVHYDPFFYPLDAVGHWNRLYGKRGFLQYQYAVPAERGIEATRNILTRIAESGEGSFLAVLKEFGNSPAAGMLSFPMRGMTLALDFAHRGASTLALLDRLDAIVLAQGGRLYPAKDARMSAASFQTFYPQWREFSRFVDPAFSSSFWRRVTETTGGEVPRAAGPRLESE
jgi:FAD/FMN-containing dehydrogenase